MATKRLVGLVGAAAFRVADLLWDMPLVSAGLAEGTAANTIKTTVACKYAIAGVIYNKAITDNIAMTALAVQAVSTHCNYLVTIDSAGTVALVKGAAIASTLDKDLATKPAVTASTAALGYITVTTDATHTFTSGTTDLSAAGITAVYTNTNLVQPWTLSDTTSYGKTAFFDNYKVRALGFLAKSGNVGAIYVGPSTIASDGSNGKAVSNSAEEWVSMGSIVGMSDRGLIDLREWYFFGGTAGDVVFIDCIG